MSFVNLAIVKYSISSGVIVSFALRVLYFCKAYYISSAISASDLMSFCGPPLSLLMSELGTRLFQLKLKYYSCLFSPIASMNSAIFIVLNPFQLRSSSIRYLEF